MGIIDDALDIEPTIKQEEIKDVAVVSNDMDIDSDYEYIRRSLYGLNDKGDEAIELMLDLARESDHPRAYEVLGQLIKNNAEIAEKLMKLQKSKKEITGGTQEMPAQNTTNNNVFIGSTNDLQKLLNDVPVINGQTE
jgi:hypothetical protein